MALRLRRGTDAERLGITPLAGELIYTTDTKKLFVGDGLTAGGIEINSAINIDNLTDVDTSTSSPAIGNVLKWNGTNWIPAEDSASGLVTGADYSINIIAEDSTRMLDVANNALVGALTGDVVGNLTGDVVGSVFADNSSVLVDSVNGIHYGNFVGPLTGDVVGSVFADDSSVIVDAISKKISIGSLETDSINLPIDRLVVTNSNIDTTSFLHIISNNDRSILKLANSDIDSDLSVADTAYGSILFERDDINGPITTGVIAGSSDRIIFVVDDGTNTFPEANYLTIRETGDIGIGTGSPSAKLDVRGNAKVNGFIQFGSFTTIERNELTPTNGMVIYNTTDNRFQGYQDNVWINLDGSGVPVALSGYVYQIDTNGNYLTDIDGAYLIEGI